MRKNIKRIVVLLLTMSLFITSINYCIYAEVLSEAETTIEDAESMEEESADYDAEYSDDNSTDTTYPEEKDLLTDSSETEGDNIETDTIEADEETTDDIIDDVVMPDDVTANGFATGTGTVDDPFIISDKAELLFWAESINKGKNYYGQYIRLGSNIYLNDLDEWDSYDNNNEPDVVWPGLNGFAGEFDGDSHSIFGLYINRTSDNTGFFNVFNNKTIVRISNLKLEDVKIYGGNYVGGIIGLADYVDIRNCYVSGEIVATGNYVGGFIGYSGSPAHRGTHVYDSKNASDVSGGSQVGGIVGYAYIGNRSGIGQDYAHGTEQTILNNCINTGDITGRGSQIGGICGYTSRSYNCWGMNLYRLVNTGSVKGSSDVGGLFGYVYSSSYDNSNNLVIRECCNTGETVSGSSYYVGGIFGEIRRYDGGKVQVLDCYNTSSVKGSSIYVGGITGGANSSVVVRHSYNYGKVTGLGSYANAIIGYGRTYGDGQAEASDNYYLEKCANGVANSAATSNNTALRIGQFRLQSKFSLLDFDNTWVMGERYPILAHQLTEDYVPSKSEELYYYSNKEMPFNSKFREDYMGVPFDWGFELFNKSSDVYNPNLALASLVLSSLAYDVDSMEDVLIEMDLINNNPFDHDFIKIGDDDNDGKNDYRIPYTFVGYKQINTEEGFTNLFTIVVRGTDGKADVLTDITDGNDFFESSEAYIRNEVLKFMCESTGLSIRELKHQNNIIYISGHSLGGAVANKLSDSLIDYADADKIYTYTYESPHTCNSKEAVASESNAYNFINTKDIVPKLPSSITLYLRYLVATWQDEVGIGALDDYDYQEFLDDCVQTTYGTNYYFTNNSILGSFFTQVVPGGNPTKKPYSPKHKSCIFDMHHLDWDLAAIWQSLSGISPYVIPSNEILISINCPVDVQIYDGNVLVAETVGSEAKNYYDDKLQILVHGENLDEKLIFVWEDSSYDIRIKGTDEGTMDYVVATINYADEDMTVNEEFYDVEVNSGTVFTSNIDTEKLKDSDEEFEIKLFEVDPLDGSVLNEIEPAHSKDELWVAGVNKNGYVYTGNAIKPRVAVYHGKRLLVEGTDYSISYKNNVNVADESSKNVPTITVKGKKNYKESDVVQFKIVEKDIADKDISIEVADKAYDGKEKKSKPVIKHGKKTLKENKDYELSYDDNLVSAGEVKITIHGKGNYTGERTVTYKIYDKSKNFSQCYVEVISPQTYDGYEITPEVIVKADKNSTECLAENVDYIVDYINNTNVGTATAVVTGIGDYAGYGNNKKASFKILPKNLANEKIVIMEESTYSGSKQEPKVVLKDSVSGRTIDSKDYSVSYKNNINARSADEKNPPEVIITGKKNCSGSVSQAFTINPMNLWYYGVEVELSDMLKSTKYPSATSLKPIVRIGDKTLVKNKDYVIYYEPNEDSADQSVTIYFTGNYTGSAYGSFKLLDKKIDISTLEIEILEDEFTYTSSQIRPAVSVGKKIEYNYLGYEGYYWEYLTEGRDYKVSYYNNVKACGKGTKSSPYLIVQGLGIYSGASSKVEFAINPKELTLDDNEIIVGDMKCTGKALTPKVTVTDKETGKKLSAGDYLVTYSDNITTTGNPTVIVSAKPNGNYSGSISQNFRIYKKNITEAAFDSIESVIYTGERFTPDGDSVKIYADRTKKNRLQENTDYELEYATNCNVGTGTVIVKGKGEYGGSKKLTFMILPKWMKWLIK